jgi:hypothetical protein
MNTLNMGLFSRIPMTSVRRSYSSPIGRSSPVRALVLSPSTLRARHGEAPKHFLTREYDRISTDPDIYGWFQLQMVILVPVTPILVSRQNNGHS